LRLGAGSSGTGEKIQTFFGQLIRQILHNSDFFPRDIVKMYPRAHADGAAQGLRQSPGHAQGYFVFPVPWQAKNAVLTAGGARTGKRHGSYMGVPSAEQALRVPARADDADLKGYSSGLRRKTGEIFHNAGTLSRIGPFPQGRHRPSARRVQISVDFRADIL
jgi:hypothetical protein